MAASFTAQPAAQVSAYRPVMFQVQSDAVSELIEKLYVRVLDLDDTELATYRVDWYSRTGSGPYEYFFRFDIQGLLQSLLDPKPSAKGSVFLDPNETHSYATGASISVSVSVQFEYRNDDNLLEAFPDELNSEVVTAFTLVQQHDETQGLGDYTDPSTRKLLHNAPDYIPIREGELFTMATVFSEQITHLIVQARTKAGVLLTGLAALTFDDPTEYDNRRVAVAGVGPRTLNTITWLGGTGLSDILIDDTIAEYWAGFGQYDPDSPYYALYTEVLNFTLLDRCPDTMRLHWMNERGGADAYTFDGRRLDSVEATSSRGEKPLTWTAGVSPYHDKNQRGRFRQSVSRSDTWELETRVLYEDVARWLTELAASPEVYIEPYGADYYLPAEVLDAKVVPHDTEEVGAIIKLTIQTANDRIIQRN